MEEEIIKALELKNQLDALRPIDKEHEAIIMQKFRLDWNYHSNHLEGNSLNYGETKALILLGITAQGKPLKDHFEITGHNEAINWVIDMVSGERPLTENFIRELHKLLLKESSEKPAITPDGQPTTKRINVGSYKTTPNHVVTATGETFYFATPEETPAKMTDLLNWYTEKKTDNKTNPILLAAEFHYQFIRIHPFDDGNGRTARILMNFILMQFGFPPVIIKTEDKENYYAALRIADVGDLEPFLKYIAENLVRSLEIMISGAKGESVEEPDDLDKELALLEQRLSNFGKQIDKIKSTENIQNIFENTIAKLAIELDKKFQKFEDYYLNKGIYFNNGSVETKFSKYERYTLIEKNTQKVVLGINYNSIKKKGLEDFRFYYDIIFEFNQMTYSVYDNSLTEKLFTKYYENLTDSEISVLVKRILKNYTASINAVLDKNKS